MYKASMVLAVREFTYAKVAKHCIVKANLGVLEFVVEAENRKQIFCSVML